MPLPRVLPTCANATCWTCDTTLNMTNMLFDKASQQCQLSNVDVIDYLDFLTY